MIKKSLKKQINKIVKTSKKIYKTQNYLSISAFASPVFQFSLSFVGNLQSSKARME